MGLEQTNFVQLFHFKDVTNKFLKVDNPFESFWSNTYVTDAETEAIRQVFFHKYMRLKALRMTLGALRELTGRKVLTFPLFRPSTHSWESYALQNSTGCICLDCVVTLSCVPLFFQFPYTVKYD